MSQVSCQRDQMFYFSAGGRVGHLFFNFLETVAIGRVEINKTARVKKR